MTNQAFLYAASQLECNEIMEIITELPHKKFSEWDVDEFEP